MPMGTNGLRMEGVMQAAIAKALMLMLAKLVTEKFFSKVIVQALDYLAKSSANQLDDKMVAAMAEALDIKI